MKTISDTKLPGQVIFFDGYCVACNSLISIVLDHDINREFYFATLQSEVSREILKLHQYKSHDPLGSVVYLKDGKLKTKSNAIIAIGSDMGGIFKVALLLNLIPGKIRDFFYDCFARRRYALFGKRKECRIPSLLEQDRFLESHKG